jgi:hypothetical protein
VFVVRRFGFCLGVFLFFIGLMAGSASGQNLLLNPGFEEPIDEVTKLPVGWPSLLGATTQWGTNVLLSDDAYEGKHSILITTQKQEGHGLRSRRIPVTPGNVYKGSAMIKGPGYIYLEFWDDKGVRIHTKAVLSKSQTTWQRYEVVETAPPGAVEMTFLLYMGISRTGSIYYDDARVVDTADEVMAIAMGDEYDLVTDDSQLDYSPADGAVMTRNPAPFVWVPISGVSHYELQISTSLEFTPESTRQYGQIDLSVYTPAELMDNDLTYYWRVRGVMPDGTALPWSTVRSFRYDRHAVELPLPDMETVRASIPTSHPRLFVRPETLADFRALATTDLFCKAIANDVRSKALQQMWMPLPEEPPMPRVNGVWDYDKWVEAWSGGRMTMRRLENMAFHYLLTESPQVGEAVRKWALAVAGWDPAGATSSAVNDDIAQYVLFQTARAYTWANDVFTEEERQIIRDMMRIRGNEMYNNLKRLPYESRPYHSHYSSQLMILVEAAIAFMGEIPEAETWFDYVVRVAFAVHPPWGGDAGGWAEGQRYWTMSMNKIMWFTDAMKVATSLDFYQKPFFANNGWFKIYTQPPYAKISPFGDFADEGVHNDTPDVMSHYAAIFQNPYYKWYAEETGLFNAVTPMAYIRRSIASPAHVESKEPSDLPQARSFPDIGWVAMHRDLPHEEENIQFMFKSSPYGSVSHSLADQNTFTIEAFGEPLAISSGYRPWYGSEHHYGWTKQTQAHNGILIDGQGQPINNIAAKGKITGFLTGSSFDYTVGDAAQAYPNAERFLRHVVYVRPDVFVMFDDLRATKPVTYDWLLHSYYPMEVADTGTEVIVPGAKANLTVRFYQPQRLVSAQTNQFAVPLDHEMDKPEQWHLKLTTTEPALEQTFLTSLVARKAADTRAEPIIEPISVTNGYGLSIYEPDRGADTFILFAGASSQGTLSCNAVSADAVVVGVRLDAQDQVSGLFVAGGTRLVVAGQEWIRTNVPVSVEATYMQEGSVTGSIETAAAAEVRLHIPFAATELLVDGHILPIQKEMTNGRQQQVVIDLPGPGTYVFALR